MRKQSDLNEVYSPFAGWLSRVLNAEIPNEVVAFVFNLYEGEESFDVQLAGCTSYTSDDESWAVKQPFSSGADLFQIPRSVVGPEWADGLSSVKQFIARYISEGSESVKLKYARAVAVGFVDGDLDVLHKLT
jgi:hypothetical protein